MIDLLAEGRPLELAQILELQRLKTGALIGFACEAGAILGGAAAPARQALLGYAADLGLAFQIQDDLLDVTGDAEVTGKDLGRDAASGQGDRGRAARRGRVPPPARGAARERERASGPARRGNGRVASRVRLCHKPIDVVG